MSIPYLKIEVDKRLKEFCCFPQCKNGCGYKVTVLEDCATTQLVSYCCFTHAVETLKLFHKEFGK